MVRGVMISTHHSYHAADHVVCDQRPQTINYGVTVYSDNMPAVM